MRRIDCVALRRVAPRFMVQVLHHLHILWVSIRIGSIECLVRFFDGRGSGIQMSTSGISMIWGNWVIPGTGRRTSSSCTSQKHYVHVIPVADRLWPLMQPSGMSNMLSIVT